MTDLSTKEEFPELYNKVPDEIADWLGTLAQVHRSKAVLSSDHETKEYTEADLELERAKIFQLVINFLSNHSTFALECYSDGLGTEIIPELNNLVFNKQELEDIIILQPISNDISAKGLSDIVENIDMLREHGYFKDKPVMVIDSEIRVMKARLGVQADVPKEKD